MREGVVLAESPNCWEMALLAKPFGPSVSQTTAPVMLAVPQLFSSWTMTTHFLAMHHFVELFAATRAILS
jgi:hypothetical protein